MANILKFTGEESTPKPKSILKKRTIDSRLNYEEEEILSTLPRNMNSFNFRPDSEYTLKDEEEEKFRGKGEMKGRGEARESYQSEGRVPEGDAKNQDRGSFQNLEAKSRQDFSSPDNSRMRAEFGSKGKESSTKREKGAETSQFSIEKIGKELKIEDCQEGSNSVIDEVSKVQEDCHRLEGMLSNTLDRISILRGEGKRKGQKRNDAKDLFKDGKSPSSGTGIRRDFDKRFSVKSQEGQGLKEGLDEVLKENNEIFRSEFSPEKKKVVFEENAQVSSEEKPGDNEKLGKYENLRNREKEKARTQNEYRLDEKLRNQETRFDNQNDIIDEKTRLEREGYLEKERLKMKEREMGKKKAEQERKERERREIKYSSNLEILKSDVHSPANNSEAKLGNSTFIELDHQKVGREPDTKVKEKLRTIGASEMSKNYYENQDIMRRPERVETEGNYPTEGRRAGLHGFDRERSNNKINEDGINNSLDANNMANQQIDSKRIKNIMSKPDMKHYNRSLLADRNNTSGQINSTGISRMRNFLSDTRKKIDEVPPQNYSSKISPYNNHITQTHTSTRKYPETRFPDLEEGRISHLEERDAQNPSHYHSRHRSYNFDHNRSLMETNLDTAQKRETQKPEFFDKRSSSTYIEDKSSVHINPSSHYIGSSSIRKRHKILSTNPFVDDGNREYYLPAGPTEDDYLLRQLIAEKNSVKRRVQHTLNEIPFMERKLDHCVYIVDSLQEEQMKRLLKRL